MSTLDGASVEFGMVIWISSMGVAQLGSRRWGLVFVVFSLLLYCSLGLWDMFFNVFAPDFVLYD